ncbi:MAG: beta-ketoacyl synthase chain length factor [Steroidobacteraceae bacterium]
MTARGELSAALRGIGLLGPGLSDWPSAAAVLAGERPYQHARTSAPAPTLLPPAERRRTGETVRLALAAALQALEGTGTDPEGLATVFASSGGDGAICHEICSTLTTEQREISPTRFHNSVHNAASGYWSIAVHSMAPSTALCAYDGSFAAGLLEALTQARASATAVLLVAYETRYPEPLHTQRPLLDAFALALLLDPRPTQGACAHLQAHLVQEAADTLDDPALERLRTGVPAARSLPVLQRIARGERGRVVLDYLGPLRLAVTVAPCP